MPAGGGAPHAHPARDRAGRIRSRANARLASEPKFRRGQRWAGRARRAALDGAGCARERSLETDR